MVTKSGFNFDSDYEWDNYIPNCQPYGDVRKIINKPTSKKSYIPFVAEPIVGYTGPPPCSRVKRAPSMVTVVSFRSRRTFYSCNQDESDTQSQSSSFESLKSSHQPAKSRGKTADYLSIRESFHTLHSISEARREKSLASGRLRCRRCRKSASEEHPDVPVLMKKMPTLPDTDTSSINGSMEDEIGYVTLLPPLLNNIHSLPRNNTKAAKQRCMKWVQEQRRLVGAWDIPPFDFGDNSPPKIKIEKVEGPDVKKRNGYGDAKTRRVDRNSKTITSKVEAEKEQEFKVKCVVKKLEENNLKDKDVFIKPKDRKAKEVPMNQDIPEVIVTNKKTSFQSILGPRQGGKTKQVTEHPNRRMATSAPMIKLDSTESFRTLNRSSAQASSNSRSGQNSKESIEVKVPNVKKENKNQFTQNKALHTSKESLGDLAVSTIKENKNFYQLVFSGDDGTLPSMDDTAFEGQGDRCKNGTGDVVDSLKYRIKNICDEEKNHLEGQMHISLQPSPKRKLSCDKVGYDLDKKQISKEERNKRMFIPGDPRFKATCISEAMRGEKLAPLVSRTDGRNVKNNVKVQDRIQQIESEAKAKNEGKDVTTQDSKEANTGQTKLEARLSNEVIERVQNKSGNSATMKKRPSSNDYLEEIEEWNIRSLGLRKPGEAFSPLKCNISSMTLPITQRQVKSTRSNLSQGTSVSLNTSQQYGKGKWTSGRRVVEGSYSRSNSNETNDSYKHKLIPGSYRSRSQQKFKSVSEAVAAKEREYQESLEKQTVGCEKKEPKMALSRNESNCTNSKPSKTDITERNAIVDNEIRESVERHFRKVTQSLTDTNKSVGGNEVKNVAATRKVNCHPSFDKRGGLESKERPNMKCKSSEGKHLLSPVEELKSVVAARKGKSHVAMLRQKFISDSNLRSNKVYGDTSREDTFTLSKGCVPRKGMNFNHSNQSSIFEDNTVISFNTACNGKPCDYLSVCSSHSLVSFCRSFCDVRNTSSCCVFESSVFEKAFSSQFKLFYQREYNKHYVTRGANIGSLTCLQQKDEARKGGNDGKKIKKMSILPDHIRRKIDSLKFYDQFERNILYDDDDTDVYSNLGNLDSESKGYTSSQDQGIMGITRSQPYLSLTQSGSPDFEEQLRCRTVLSS